MISTKVQEEQAVMIVHTLGPKGTNCEKAGLLWLKNKGVRGEVRLYETLEEALPHVKSTENSVLLGCAVYPFLHQIVFENLADIKIIDSFVMPTYNMVFAAKQHTMASDIQTVASHPAPAHLAKLFSSQVQFVTSNAQAALACASNAADGCITTIKAADEHRLKVIQDFGEVPMCFTIHGLKSIEGGSR
ncbi:prephenate dehydratase domain-containing protein [Bacillus paralicheniformis]|uniref:prephenate dehydratase domain-containing protein n=1 Tax=Bacillus paralicheniformis TaxID=1648923 RepID=UPI0011AB8E44|nr:prephenate dehydratase domain-containing protein [Bacillus paralicheniformis]MCU4670780.1 hypothetical protein [Bacillus paralicheniformis]MEC1826246.1 prephenate dehydratase domain-containing protein [Bacillus paralicheniformis]TWK26323.1 hypothetical protein CHCC20372_1367 [Bacillus paralicheniformis]